MQKYCHSPAESSEQRHHSSPDDEAIRLTDSPQTRMKPGFVRNQVYYSYNNFTTNENPWMKRHGTAGTLAVPFCYHDME